VYAPPKPAGILHEIDESESQELFGHAELENVEKYREIAFES
jgi:hypothetical protein